MSLNKVMLIGNVGQDPEVRYLENSSAKVASFRLATTERYRDRNGELRENTEWHSIVAWRNSADLAEKYIRKGTSIFVEGRLRTRSWDDQNGQKHSVTEVVADNIQLLGKKSDNPATGAAAPQSQPYQAPQPQVRQASDIPAGFAPAAQPKPAPAFTAPAAPAGEDDLPF
ncbi:MAG: single-stranded DNA-binding protein [Bacteroidales bacterium]|nr:single-stranded DNA-binding protein [Bacteroidales bacterium]